MKKNRIKSPLKKRVWRELRGDWKKYLLVCLFLILTIGFVAGMYVANGSMLLALDESADLYKQEDGHFEYKDELTSHQIKEIASGKLAEIPGYKPKDYRKTPLHIFKNYYLNLSEDRNRDGKEDGGIRLYQKTDNINLSSVLKGRLPKTGHEIAIDRMHADNRNIKVGDTIDVSGKTFTITGLIAYVNYSTLYEKNTDTMFDALNFDVAMVTKDGFDRFDENVHYNYAFLYDHSPKNVIEEKKMSDRVQTLLFTHSMAEANKLEDYLPRYANHAMNFAKDDIGSDEAMGSILLYVLVVIIAFIFAITITTTITKEASSIGTLRATGYTKGELVRHYITAPILVTLFSAIVGNILGYTVFKNIVVNMYYNSYSLPVYHTVWNGQAFLRTTVVPVVLMFLVNLVIITRMIQHTPLDFLRHNLKKTKKGKAMRLPKWNFFFRFRLRIVFQNLSNYLTLFLGVFFVMVMLAMSIGLPDTLAYYKDNATDMMFAKYQYVLKRYQDKDGKDITTTNTDAEKFNLHTLQKKTPKIEEEVSVYGVALDSHYITSHGLKDLKDRDVYVSFGYQKKYHLKTGDTLHLDEKYEDKHYTFRVAGFYEKCQTVAIFLPIDNYRKIFKLKQGAFTGYMSDTPIKDIPNRYIATTITKKDIVKMCNQLDHSLGGYMIYYQVLCTLLSAVLIYLLTKIIIERNETSIAMTKILGYSNYEIARLYLLPTTILLLVFDGISIVLGCYSMNRLWQEMMKGYSGFFEFHIQPVGYAKMFLFVLIGYLIAMLIDFHRIKKIPLDQALKNVE